MDTRFAESINLPGGLFDDDGTCHRETVLCPLRGAEEDWILSLRQQVAEPSLVTELLSRCTERIGSMPATPDLIRRFTVGDRDFLMMQLRRMSFGNKVDATLNCPNLDCGKKMDATFNLNEIPVETQELQRVYCYESWKFRLPQGGDQEALSCIRDSSYRSMVNRLLSRCLVNVSDETVQSLPESTIAGLESAMERVAPKVDFQMEAICPECGLEFSTHFHPASFCLDEILRQRSIFDREIHLLSFHYHWPLHEILSMTRERRHRYLRCLLDHLDTLPQVPA